MAACAGERLLASGRFFVRGEASADGRSALVTVVFRPIGGWLSGRAHPAPVTAWALGLTALLAVAQAFEPELQPLGTLFLLLMAAALGTGSGSVYAFGRMRDATPDAQEKTPARNR